MTVSSMMPPLSFKMTESVDEYGERDEREDGVIHSRNSVAVAPRKLQVVIFRLREHSNTNRAYFD
jgi:hypothetical protein